MNAARSINRLLRRHGKPIILVQPGVNNSGVRVNAFLQPMRYKNKMYLDSQYTRLGIMDESSFLLIAPAEPQIDEYTDFLVDGDEQYAFVKAERVYFTDSPAYTWAILRKRG